jgi:hypothetical protein
MIEITGPHADGTMRVHFRGSRHSAALLQPADTPVGRAMLECKQEEEGYSPLVRDRPGDNERRRR